MDDVLEKCEPRRWAITRAVETRSEKKINRIEQEISIKETAMNRMRILGKSGDIEFKWDPETGYGLKTAKLVFGEKTRASRYLAFIEGPSGEGITMIRQFDPNAESIILTPRLIGG